MQIGNAVYVNRKYLLGAAEMCRKSMAPRIKLISGSRLLSALLKLPRLDASAQTEPISSKATLPPNLTRKQLPIPAAEFSARGK
jgi:hypothetical protein